MEYLFSLKPSQTLSEGIKALSQFQIGGLAYSTIVQRGYEYFSAGAVYPNVKVGHGKYELECSGNYGEYEIVIKKEGNKVKASCDCPYDDGTCKHIIASLLYLQNHVSTLKEADISDAIIVEEEQEQDTFEGYVRNLPIEELQRLVLEFAPEHFRKETMIKQKIKKGDTKKVDKAYINAAINMTTLFSGELYNVKEFEEDVETALKKLRPFWQTHSRKIADELANFMQKVEEAIEEGYLQGGYDYHYDEYYEENYEAGEVSDYIGEFIGAIPNEERKYAITKILTAHQKLGYGICDDVGLQIIESIPIEQLPQFANLAIEMELFQLFNANDTQRLYDKIKLYLNDNQRETILKEQSNVSSFNLELAKIYETKQEFQNAYNTLENSLKDLSSNGYFYSSNEERHEQFQLIIRLCENNLDGEKTLFWINKYLNVLPSVTSFQTATQYHPEQRMDFENFFEQRYITVFVEILETENRLNKVVKLFEQHRHEFRNTEIIYRFFQRHKKQFPHEAELEFRRRLSEYLQEARQSNYIKVSEILGELQPILSKKDFTFMVNGIKKKYYRRRNLLAILEGRGF